MRLPRAKKQLLTTKPDDREKMSVNLPHSGCVIACPIRKAVASQARSESELKLVAIGAARLAMIVPSERPMLGLVSCTVGQSNEGVTPALLTKTSHESAHPKTGHDP